MAQIAVLSPFSPESAASWHDALRAGLRAQGWIEGSNYTFTFRYSYGDDARLSPLAIELASLKPDLIVTEVTPSALVARQATSTIPIVMIGAGDPVSVGLVEALGRPGGNVTGISQNIVETTGKRIELLRSVAPQTGRVAVLWNTVGNASTTQFAEVQAVANKANLALREIPVRGAADLDRQLNVTLEPDVAALYVVASPLLFARMGDIARLAERHRLASIFSVSDYARSGGLLAYGPDRKDQFRRAASYISKLLKGARPADLPVEQPDKFEFVINLRTAQALGITIPALVLAQADELIE